METPLLESLDKNSPAGFVPRPRYVPEADAIVFFFKADDSYAERVDNLLTVYRSFATHQMVGCEIKGVRRTLELLGSFGVEVDDGSVHLGLLFLAYMASTSDHTPRAVYEQLGRTAREMGARISFGDSALA